MINLCFYQPIHKEALLDFDLPETQKSYTAIPSEALDLCLHDNDRHPAVIMSGSMVVGFFVLHHGQGIRFYTDNPNAILIRALSINFVYQGNGYDKSAMLLLPDFVAKNFKTIDEMILAVNEGNVAAKQLYEKTGLRETGIQKQGRVGMQYILRYPIKRG